MAINFPNSPSNGDTHTAAGQTFTYDGTAGVWNPPAAGNAAITTDGSTPSLASGITGAEVRTLIGAGTAAARTAVYANIAALPTSGTAGDMAYVTATNRLYIWTGTGWYNIALINNNPTISGVNATYDLAMDGTATTVTITATDPEGLPITYSIASDTSGNIATVAQGTGANTNVFTITPSTSEANAGTFSLTFRASDGVNIASAAASFTLEFKVTNSQHTKALITSVGANNAVNNSFTDSSTNTHTITTTGTAQCSSFTPHHPGGYSGDTNGGYFLTQNTSSAGTSDWTWEGWIRTTDPAGSIWMKYTGGNQADGINLISGVVNTHSDVGQDANTGSIRVDDGKWHYVVVERYNGTLKTWVDGTADSSSSNTENCSRTGGWYIGKFGVSSVDWNGEVRDIRWRHDGAEYQGTFSSSDVPTEPVTARSTTTVHLFRGKPYFEGITASGSEKLTRTSPYEHVKYEAATHGSSMYADGNSDYVSLANDSSLALNKSTGDFTIEAWIYPRATGNLYPGWINNQATSWADNGFSARFDNSGDARWTFYRYPTQPVIQSSSQYAHNSWYHVALTRDSGTLRLFINGNLDGTVTSNTTDFNLDRNGTRIGHSSWDAANGYFPGNISDLRVVKGTAVYTSAFSPPTSPLTAITNTSLLLNTSGQAITDKSGYLSRVELYGDTKSSTTQTKYLSSSMYFDGTGDYIKADGFGLGNVGTGDFTAEGWFYLTASPSNYITVIATRASNASTAGWVMAISASDFYVYSGAHIVRKNSAISSNQWYHWAYSRENGTHRLFLDGTLLDSSTTARTYTEHTFWIGAKYDGSEYFTGYQRCSNDSRSRKIYS